MTKEEKAIEAIGERSNIKEGDWFICDHCNRRRRIYPYPDNNRLWCGTCISRDIRRINQHEMWGHGKRGY